MTKIAFIFFCCLYLTISILSFGDDIPQSYEVATCIVLILLVGVPHGAIDHLLFFNTTDGTQIQFYTGYLISMTAYAIVWYFLPGPAMVIFLAISAYHFGESQFSYAADSIPRLKSVLYSLWGCHILSTLFYYNFGELSAVASATPDLEEIMSVTSMMASPIVPIATGVGTVCCIAYLWIQQQISKERLLTEIMVLVLIHLCFFLLPLLVAFTLYFVILHSGQVFMDEYTFLRNKFRSYSTVDFIKSLLPFSLISFAGTGILVALKVLGYLPISYILGSIILISIVTLPHSFVMNTFYHNRIKSS